MPRCPIETHRILHTLEGRLDARPDAGVVVATAEVEDGGNSVGVQVSDAGCSPVQLVAVAHECLTAASERIRAMPEWRDFLDLIGAIERAKAALDLTPPTAAH